MWKFRETVTVVFRQPRWNVAEEEIYHLTNFVKPSTLDVWQGSEYLSDPKYTKMQIQNIAKFWMSQGCQQESVLRLSEYARICFDRVLNISWVLNMPGLWLLWDSDYARVAEGMYINMPQYGWISE